MTETLSNALTQGGIYNHVGRLMIAVNERDLMLLLHSSDTRYVRNDDTALVCDPGTQEWTNRMLEAREALATDLRNEQAETTRRKTFLTNLGEALREKAIAKRWCEEYDEFAQEWDLPPCAAEFDVTLTIRVTARNSDAAEELLSQNLSINEYNDEVIDGPRYSVERVND
jgi:hypothetical protein